MLTVNYKTSRDYIMSIFEIRNLNVRYTTPAHDEESILSVSDKTRLRKINNKPFYFQRDKASTTQLNVRRNAFNLQKFIGLML